MSPLSECFECRGSRHAKTIDELREWESTHHRASKVETTITNYLGLPEGYTHYGCKQFLRSNDDGIKIATVTYTHGGMNDEVSYRWSNK